MLYLKFPAHRREKIPSFRLVNKKNATSKKKYEVAADASAITFAREFSACDVVPCLRNFALSFATLIEREEASFGM